MKAFKAFIDEVAAELKKAERKDTDIDDAQGEFNRLYQEDMVKNFNALQGEKQKVKDRYFALMKNAAAGMTQSYQKLNGKIDGSLKNLKGLSPDLEKHNETSRKKLEQLKAYCEARIVKEPVLEDAVTCRLCGFSLTDILNYTDLSQTKENERMMIETEFVITPPKDPDPGITKPDVGDDSDGDDGHSGSISNPSSTNGRDPGDVGEGSTTPPIITPRKPRKMTLSLDGDTMTVEAYRAILTRQIQQLNSFKESDEIELHIEGL